MPLEERLTQHIRRLQILHDIEHAILSIQDEQATARTALVHISDLAPSYQASSVLLLDLKIGEAIVLAVDGDIEGSQAAPAGQSEDLTGRRFALDVLPIDISVLQDGQPFIVHDLSVLPEMKPLQQQMAAIGICSYLSVPLRWGGELIGVLNLASNAPDVFQAEHVQIAQEIANSLAVAIQQTRLLRAEQVRRQEAEVMRDLMAALAFAGNLNQTLQAILVNLHNLIHYDRASLFLVDENERFVMADKGFPAQETGKGGFQENDPLIAEMRRTRRPLIIPDVQTDSRFENWPDLGSVRGWLGAPLLMSERAGAQAEMIGFLSLGSLVVNDYDQTDAETMQVFASQVAQVLERAWQHEQSHRRTEELEVLSRITLALGQAESAENTLLAVIEQLIGFFGASRGAFLFPDRALSTLAVKACPVEALVGMVHPYQRDDLLWRVYQTGQAAILTDVDAQAQMAPIYPALWGGAQAGAVIPLKAEEEAFGLLCFAFENRRKLTPENVRLFNAVASMASASLRRAVVLEALEKQVDIRTQHLSTLYHINAVASEPLDLQIVLDQVLEITLHSMNSRAGAIHFMDDKGRELYLASQKNLTLSGLSAFDSLSLSEPFWSNLVDSTSPLVLPDISSAAGLPAALAQAADSGRRVYLGAPIRAKGQVLGLLSMFGETELEYSIEDITLFMTIADQIGGLVERARLVKQAELAAVVQERQRLARELHDSVTQLLYSQVLFSGAGLKVLGQGNQPLAESHLSRIEQAAQQALKEMRLLVYELRPSDELDEGLASALERRLDAVEKRTGINARLVVEGMPVLDRATEMAIYRIAEEALNNTLKHAQASAVNLRIAEHDGRLILEITDNGRGFDLVERLPDGIRRSGGMGLYNMGERAAALGGDLQISSGPGQGTCIYLSIEIPPKESSA